jgi:hypothetical protein
MHNRALRHLGSPTRGECKLPSCLPSTPDYFEKEEIGSCSSQQIHYDRIVVEIGAMLQQRSQKARQKPVFRKDLSVDSC